MAYHGKLLDQDFVDPAAKAVVAVRTDYTTRGLPAAERGMQNMLRLCSPIELRRAENANRHAFSLSDRAVSPPPRSLQEAFGLRLTPLVWMAVVGGANPLDQGLLVRI
jgi:hypothetical protein